MAQTNYTYTKASITCASLTEEAVFIPGFQHPLASTEHQREDPISANVHEKSPPAENSLFSQSQKEDQRQQVTRCFVQPGNWKERGARSVCHLAKGSPALQVFNRSPTNRGRVLLEHVGINSQQYSIHESQTGFAPARLRNHQQIPTPHASSTTESFGRDCLKGEQTGKRAFSKTNSHYFSNNYAITKIN